MKNFHLIEKQPLLLELAFVKHTLYSRTKAFNLDKFYHEAI